MDAIKDKIHRDFNYVMSDNDFTDMYFHVTGFNTSMAKSFPILEFTADKSVKKQKNKLLEKTNIALDVDPDDSENDQMSDNDIGKL